MRDKEEAARKPAPEPSPVRLNSAKFGVPGEGVKREIFCKLADPAKYVACGLDLVADGEAREHWVEFFKRHVNTILELGVAALTARGMGAGEAAERADDCRERFYEQFDAFKREPASFGPVTILTLDAWRENCLREAGFEDPFIDLKDRENERMLPLLAVVCRQIDELKEEEQFRAVVEGVFAGNVFDMGAEATAKAFLGKSPDFFATRATLKKRPWLIDDFDEIWRSFARGKEWDRAGPVRTEPASPVASRKADPPSPHAGLTQSGSFPCAYRKALFFIDNAGSDFLLGALPMIRWMAQRGTRVVIAANERPALNDMTIHDLEAWWPRIVEAERSLGELPIERVSTGTGEPMIDLSKVSAELNAACADADLVILEGMGRGVESNLEAKFSCDAMNLAMIKDSVVARYCGGELFDIVCKFRARYQ